MRCALTSRERVLAGSALALVAAAALWTQVLQPALSSREGSFATLAKIDALQTVLQRMPERVGAVQAVDPAEPLQVRVTRTARAAGLDIRRLDPQGAALSVSLENVRFEVLMLWLEAMTTGAGVQVIAAELGRLPEPGHVTARLLLEAAR